jgi:hypothetical protein
MGDALSDLDAASTIAELEIYTPEVVGKIELNLGIEV